MECYAFDDVYTSIRDEPLTGLYRDFTISGGADRLTLTGLFRDDGFLVAVRLFPGSASRPPVFLVREGVLLCSLRFW